MTLTHWLRQFEKWLPTLRAVPFYGDTDSRAVMEQYELFHTMDVEGRQPLKAHIVVAAESTARLFPHVLGKVQRWEALIVDEGQNLKGDVHTNLLYQHLQALQAPYRVLITGTPLNNNIGEIFPLLNWLHPGKQWKDMESLGRKDANLTPELVEELQGKLRPYFLRRLKRQVVDVPAKVELRVPISLRPVQKRVCKSIIETNIKGYPSTGP